MGPNGSGKSTLIEAIAWVLYGSGSVDRTAKEGIKRAGAAPNEDCTVKLIFELGGVQYQVRRTMRGKNLKVDAEMLGNGEVLASSERSVSSQVEKLLGMDHRAFFLSVFARQKELSALSVLAPAERKKLIVRMLELDVLQEVIDDIKRDERDEKAALQFVNEQLLTADRRPKREVLAEEKRVLGEELAALQQQLEAANYEAERLEKELEKAKGHKEWTALKEEEHRKHERRAGDKRKELDELRGRVAVVEKDLAALRARLAALPGLEERRREYEDHLRRQEEMEEGLRAHEERKAVRASLRRVLEDLARLEESIERDAAERAKLKNPQESFDAVTKNLADLGEAITARRERISALDSEARGLGRELEENLRKQEEVQTMGPGSVCPTCERQMGDHHHYLQSKLLKQAAEKGALLQPLREELSRLRAEVETDQRRKGALEERKRKLHAEVSAAERLEGGLRTARQNLVGLVEQRGQLEAALAALGEETFDEGAFAAIKERLPGLRAAAERFQALTGESARLPELEARKAEVDASIGLREGELKGIQADLAAVGYVEGDYRRAQAAYEAALKAREAGYAEVSRKVDGIEHARQRIEDKDAALAEIAELERSVDGRTKRVHELAVLNRVMGDFKQNVMERISPTLSEVSSDLFATMTDSKYGGIELDDDYEMQIYDGGERYPVSRFSGGEGDLANLCLRLAISRVLADRSGNDINFLILDEIFGSQDQVRKRAIMSTLNQLEKQFHQIILISHIDDTKDLMGNVITIKELEDGTSTVVV